MLNYNIPYHWSIFRLLMSQLVEVELFLTLSCINLMTHFISKSHVLYVRTQFVKQLQLLCDAVKSPIFPSEMQCIRSIKQQKMQIVKQYKTGISELYLSTCSQFLLSTSVIFPSFTLYTGVIESFRTIFPAVISKVYVSGDPRRVNKSTLYIYVVKLWTK